MHRLCSVGGCPKPGSHLRSVRASAIPDVGTINGLYTTEVIPAREPSRSIDQVEFATAEWVDWFHYRRVQPVPQ